MELYVICSWRLESINNVILHFWVESDFLGSEKQSSGEVLACASLVYYKVKERILGKYVGDSGPSLFFTYRMLIIGHIITLLLFNTV